MVLFLDWLDLIMSGDGLKVLHSWNDLAKMSLDGSVSVVAWFHNVRRWLEALTFLECLGLNVIGWLCFCNGLV